MSVSESSVSFIVSQEDIVAMLGPWILSTIISSTLTGVVLIQAYSYFASFPEDRPLLRYTVVLNIVLTVISFVMDGWSIWLQTIPTDRDLNLFRPLMPAMVNMQLIVVIAATTQAFFSDRAWRATSSRLVPWVTAPLIAISFLAGSSLCAFKLVASNETFVVALQTWLWTTVITDTTITGLLVWSLRSKSKGISQGGREMVKWVIRTTISTAAGVAIVAITDALLSLTNGTENNAHLLFTHILPRVYTFSLLFVLNTRTSYRNKENARCTRYMNSNDPLAATLHMSSFLGAKLAEDIKDVERGEKHYLRPTSFNLCQYPTSPSSGHSDAKLSPA